MLREIEKKIENGQDNFSCIVFDFKTVSGTGQTVCQGTEQKPKFLSSAELRDNFLSSAQVV
jgi:hypothetical protein